MKKRFFCLTGLILLFMAKAVYSQSIFINELMASNESTSVGSDNLFEDWIELYNGSENSVNLDGYYLSDSKSTLTKHQIIGSLIIAAGDYFVFYADGAPELGNNHVDFGLSAGGEAVFLTMPDGITVVDSVVFPAQKTDISYGRKINGSSEWRFISPPSPEASNQASDSYLGVLDPPEFSLEGGYYASSFDLSLSDLQGASIFYTLDGSEPDSSNLNPKYYYYKNNYSGGPLVPLTYRTYEFSGDIDIHDRSSEPNIFSNISSTISTGTPSYVPGEPINKATVVKAKSMKEGYLSSPTVAHTFFIGNGGVSRHSLPVISLNTTGENLFDYYNGVYVAGYDYEAGIAEGANFRRKTEYPISFEYFKENNREFGMNAGFRIHGSASRLYPMKSLRIYARDEYGQGRFDYRFFENSELKDYKRIMLRNTGNDYSYGALLPAMMRDAVMHKAVRNLNVGVQDYQPVVIYLNGEYWGMENIRERQDNYYLEQHFGVDRDNLDMIKNFVEVDEGDLNDYNDLHSFFINNSMTVNANYEYVKTQMDIDNFIDYEIAEIFFKNNDWIFNNISMWRERVEYSPEALPFRDGKWRWLIYDLDYGLSEPHNNLLSVAASQQIWFKSLLKNEEFKRSFINRFADLMNSTFLPDRMKVLIQEAKEKIEPEIANQIARWENINSKQEWENNVELLKTFSDLRPSAQRTHIVDQFGLNGTYPLVADVSDYTHGAIQVNSIKINKETDGLAEQPYPWKGIYFDGISIDLIASPALGYKFDHWEYLGQNYTDSLLTISSFDSVFVKAIFVEDFLSANPFPDAAVLTDCGFEFSSWPKESEAGTYPPNMAFVFMKEEDPSVDAEIDGFTSGAYNYSGKTRINGLDEDGISFINTGSGNEGFPETRLGGALLSFSTLGVNNLKLQFTAGTVEAKSREYNIGVMYRIGDKMPFEDLTDSLGELVEYKRSSQDGDEVIFSVSLPEAVMDRTYVQLFWKYYFTGVQNNQESGARDELRLDNIYLIETAELPELISSENFDLQNVDYIQGSTEIKDASNVLLHSRKAIILEPNTLIKGSVFKAEIGHCF